MTVLGLTGGLDPAHANRFNVPYNAIHDAAAVLVRDGRVLAAIEEERLNRIKHTNKMPHRAVRFCLEQAGVRAEELDAVVFYATEPYVNRILELVHLGDFTLPELLTPRGMVQRIVREAVGAEIDPQKIYFVDHHWAHAVSAYAMSGYDAALVVTLDGQGEGISGVVFDGRGRELKPLRKFTEAHSLGYLYRDVIQFLGYEMFDEYKVMGMAPYGDPAKYRALFKTFYDLLPDGDYRLHLERIPALFRIAQPRRKGGAFTETHQHIAAALQEAVEEIALHVLGHYRKTTGHTRLCLAGGVAHNCSMNGRVLYAGLFEKLFVQPAAHDAGCALGAAVAVQLTLAPQSTVEPLTDVFWGTDIGGAEEIERELRRWEAFVSVERCADIVNRAADLLAGGKAIGWVQGRSEFGPRALGNRSILADPRPAENKDIINRMVKKREAYRPFAPSVLQEKVDDYFVTTPTQKEFPTMSVILDVRPEWRERLGAITHVDGTARVQTVKREANLRYWELIRAFGERTGVAMLLNTSFNNHAEPIVDSVSEAVACFLTTDLNALVVGDFLVLKRDVAGASAGAASTEGAAAGEAWLGVRVSLPVTVTLATERRWVSATEQAWVHEVRFAYHHGKSHRVSEAMARMLGAADGKLRWRELAAKAGVDAIEARALVPELRELWTNRAVVVEPA